MRRRIGTAVIGLALACAGVADAQVRIQPRPRGPRREFLRLSASIGQQTTSETFESDQTFEQYFETGSFKFTRTIPKRPLFDGAVALRVYRRLHAGVAISVIDSSGAGSITAEIPHPLLFNQKRTVTGEIFDVARREIASHLQVSWTTPPIDGVEFTAFGGPSIFNTQQTYVTALTIGLDKEVYPFDTFSFAGASTDVFRQNLLGYNVGVDMTYRFARHFGGGLLIRYASASKDFTPTGGKPFKVKAGGLHAGGGLRIIL